MRTLPSTAVLAAATLFAVACRGKGGAGGDDTGGTVSAATGVCNPVEDSHCMLPFPSRFYLEEGADTPTGYRVRFGAETLPQNIDGVQMDPTRWNEKDGFPILGPALFHLPGATLEGLAGPWAPWASLEPTHGTVLLDAETGERYPHFVERDPVAADPSRALVYVRPAVPLPYGRRVVVAVHGLVGEDGAPVAAPAGFAALRDGRPTLDGDLESQRGRYEAEIFPLLEAQGIPREGLQLAWDYVTVSAEATLGPLLHMRDEALAATAGTGPSYTLTRVEDADCAGGGPIGRVIEGTFAAPLYLETWAPGPDSLLRRGADGMPVAEGTADVPFQVRVPCSVLSGERRGVPLQFGHGLFGQYTDVASGPVDALAEAHGFIPFAVSWTGMKREDVQAITLVMVQDPSDFVMVPDRLHQGHVEFLLAAQLLTTGLAADPALSRDGASLVDASAVHFYGLSQGGVLGGAQVAMSPFVSRAAFSVPGTPFNLLLTRAANFEPFFLLLKSKFEDPADITLILALTQMVWDPGESAGWAHHITGSPIDGTVPSDKRVLIQAAVGDRSVTTLGAQVMARAVGASTFDSPVRPIDGVPVVDTLPAGASLITEYDWGDEEPAPGTLVAGEIGPHGLPFSHPAAMEQLGAWLSTGEAIHPCDGACDPD